MKLTAGDRVYVTLTADGPNDQPDSPAGVLCMLTVAAHDPQTRTITFTESIPNYVLPGNYLFRVA